MPESDKLQSPDLYGIGFGKVLLTNARVGGCGTHSVLLPVISCSPGDDQRRCRTHSVGCSRRRSGLSRSDLGVKGGAERIALAAPGFTQR